jgi:predicted nucleic acid-binding protein
MKQNWVFDTSPLIVLGKAELLTTISPLASTWFIPEGVVQEVSQKSDIEPLLQQLSEKAQIERQNVEIKSVVASWNLGDGESEAITLAMENSEYGVILDDLQARKCATILNLPLMGSLGLIVKAKKEGLLEVVKPTFEKLIASGLYVDHQLIEKVLTSIGEK